MRELLRHRPVEAACVRARDDGAGELDLEVDVERPVALGPKIRERFGILLRRRHEPVLEQRQRRDPGPDRRRERLAEERPERLVLPRLDVTRAPVVDEDDAEDVVPERRRASPARRASCRLRRRSRARARCRAACSGPKRGVLVGGRLRLTARTHDRRPAHDDRPRTAVVPDRKVAPVGQQRLGVRPEETSEVRRVLERRVEVDVVRDRERQMRARRPRARRDRRLPSRARRCARACPPTTSGRARGTGSAFGLEHGAEAVRREVENPVSHTEADAWRSTVDREDAEADCAGHSGSTPCLRAPRPARRSCSSRSSGGRRAGRERARRRLPNERPTERTSRRVRTPTRSVSASAACSSPRTPPPRAG